LLKKYKYPPEEAEDAMNVVLKQCEQWADTECTDSEEYEDMHSFKSMDSVYLIKGPKSYSFSDEAPLDMAAESPEDF
jgi:type I restriction enzyme R subunit